MHVINSSHLYLEQVSDDKVMFCITYMLAPNACKMCPSSCSAMQEIFVCLCTTYFLSLADKIFVITLYLNFIKGFVYLAILFMPFYFRIQIFRQREIRGKVKLQNCVFTGI